MGVPQSTISIQTFAASVLAVVEIVLLRTSPPIQPLQVLANLAVEMGHSSSASNFSGSIGSFGVEAASPPTLVLDNATQDLSPFMLVAPSMPPPFAPPMRPPPPPLSPSPLAPSLQASDDDDNALTGAPDISNRVLIVAGAAFGGFILCTAVACCLIFQKKERVRKSRSLAERSRATGRGYCDRRLSAGTSMAPPLPSGISLGTGLMHAGPLGAKGRPRTRGQSSDKTDESANSSRKDMKRPDGVSSSASDRSAAEFDHGKSRSTCGVGQRRKTVLHTDASRKTHNLQFLRANMSRVLSQRRAMEYSISQRGSRRLGGELSNGEGSSSTSVSRGRCAHNLPFNRRPEVGTHSAAVDEPGDYDVMTMPKKRSSLKVPSTTWQAEACASTITVDGLEESTKSRVRFQARRSTPPMFAVEPGDPISGKLRYSVKERESRFSDSADEPSLQQARTSQIRKAARRARRRASLMAADHMGVGDEEIMGKSRSCFREKHRRCLQQNASCPSTIPRANKPLSILPTPPPQLRSAPTLPADGKVRRVRAEMGLATAGSRAGGIGSSGCGAAADAVVVETCVSSHGVARSSPINTEGRMSTNQKLRFMVRSTLGELSRPSSSTDQVQVRGQRGAETAGSHAAIEASMQAFQVRERVRRASLSNQQRRRSWRGAAADDERSSSSLNETSLPKFAVTAAESAAPKSRSGRCAYQSQLERISSRGQGFSGVGTSPNTGND